MKPNLLPRAVPARPDAVLTKVLPLSNNVIAKSRIHLKMFGITAGYD